MLKKIVLILIIGSMTVAALATGSLAQAQGGTTFTGTINNSNGCMLADANAYPVHIITFTVPTTGEYTFTYQSHTWSNDLVAYIVRDPYDPAVSIYAQFWGAGPSSHPAMPSTVTVELEAGIWHLGVTNLQVIDTYAECLARETTDAGSYAITSDLPGSGGDASLPVVAGCDQYIQLPSNAAVGTFSNWAELYWMPEGKLYPPLAMEPGQSVWVLGQDESGLYKKILLSCEFLWVEAGVIGPNYDALWNGAPLPVDVVE